MRGWSRSTTPGFNKTTFKYWNIADYCVISQRAAGHFQIAIFPNFNSVPSYVFLYVCERQNRCTVQRRSSWGQTAWQTTRTEPTKASWGVVVVAERRLRAPSTLCRRCSGWDDSRGRLSAAKTFQDFVNAGAPWGHDSRRFRSTRGWLSMLSFCCMAWAAFSPRTA